MRRTSFKRALPVLIPSFLLIAFALIITFAEKVPFLMPSIASSPGLDSEKFRVINPSDDGKRAEFTMMRVPSGSAPGGTDDKIGMLTVPSPLWLGRTEVTRGLYLAVAADSLSSGYEIESLPEAHAAVPPKKRDSLPAEGISWAGAVIWCNLLSERLGLDCAYRLPSPDGRPLKRVEDVLFLCAQGSFAATPDSSGFRLPTAAEWELAARYRDGSAWTSGSWPSGGIADWTEYSRADLVAWYDRDYPATVGTLASNALGICDMSGNVWEWCFDEFRENGESQGKPDKRVTRGGCWMGSAWRIQIGGSFGTAPDVREGGQGFRLARND